MISSFVHGLAQQWWWRGRDRNKIWHKGSLSSEDDVRTSITRIVHMCTE